MMTLIIWAWTIIEAEGYALLNSAIPDREWEPRFDAWESARAALKAVSL